MMVVPANGPLNALLQIENWPPSEFLDGFGYVQPQYLSLKWCVAIVNFYS